MFGQESVKNMWDCCNVPLKINKDQQNPMSALEAMLRVRQTALTDVAQRHKAHSCLRSPQSKQPSASVYFGDPRYIAAKTCL